jgi:alcohol dehydrogenase
MMALVYARPGATQWLERPLPLLQHAGDAIVAITHTTICGTDLHILKGDVATCQPGRILGHEGVGVVTTIGAGVTRFQPGDHVVISCITACGRCAACRCGMTSHCETGGWVLGNSIDGTQAEFVRIPHADTSLVAVPAGAAEEGLVMLSDVLPTGWECGVLNGRVAPGHTVAIVGAGPIGLSALLTAQLYSPTAILMIDQDPHRLATAHEFGATHTIDNSAGGAVAAVMQATAGRGVDTVIEAVGVPATFQLCQDIVAPGGVIANVGVHGGKVDLHLETLWSRNVTITTRLVDAGSIPLLLRLVQAGKLRPERLISHRFDLSKLTEAYATFAAAATTKALKVLLVAGRSAN